MDNKKEEKVPPKRVLWLSDFACSTGFASVAQNMVVQLAQTGKYQIDIVGINYYGMPTEWLNLFPTIRLLPASIISQGDVFGRQGYLNLLSSGAYDLTFILQDTFNIEPIADKIIEIRNNLIRDGKKTFKWIFYYPIDATPKENWITKSAMLADIPIAYTQYGYDESVKQAPSIASKLKIVPHGIDINIFKPIDKSLRDSFRKEYFVDRTKDKFLVINVNRNQIRKDIARTMQIFKLFKQQVPEAILYLHMKKNDVAYNLDEVARIFELAPDLDWIAPKDFDEHDGLNIGLLNAIYNSADLLMTTTLGEGWGLSITEAMAAKCPVIAPNHTSLTEIIRDDRGYLVSAGKRQNDWVVLSNDNARYRPVVDVAEYVDKMVHIRNHYDEAKQKAEVAYKYVHDELDWAKVGKIWQDIFSNTLTVKKQIDIGRNDPCYCGSGKKYKFCHYA